MRAVSSTRKAQSLAGNFPHCYTFTPSWASPTDPHLAQYYTAFEPYLARATPGEHHDELPAARLGCHGENPSSSGEECIKETWRLHIEVDTNVNNDYHHTLDKAFNHPAHQSPNHPSHQPSTPLSIGTMHQPIPFSLLLASIAAANPMNSSVGSCPIPIYT